MELRISTNCPSDLAEIRCQSYTWRTVLVSLGTHGRGEGPEVVGRADRGTSPWRRRRRPHPGSKETKNEQTHRYLSIKPSEVNEPSPLALLVAECEQPEARQRSDDSAMHDPDTQPSFYEQNTKSVIWFTQDNVTTTCKMRVPPSSSTFTVLSQACGQDEVCLRCAAGRTA